MDFDVRVVQHECLLEVARESVQQKAVGATILESDTLLQQLENDRVRDELSGGHVFSHFLQICNASAASKRTGPLDWDTKTNT